MRDQTGTAVHHFPGCVVMFVPGCKRSDSDTGVDDEHAKERFEIGDGLAPDLFECVSHRVGRELRQLDFGDSSHPVSAGTEVHGGWRCSDLELAVVLPYVQNLTRFEAQAIPERLGDHNTPGAVDGSFHGRRLPSSVAPPLAAG